MPFRIKLNTSEMLVIMIPYQEPPSSKVSAHLDSPVNCSNNQAFASSLSIFFNSFSLASNFFSSLTLHNAFNLAITSLLCCLFQMFAASKMMRTPPVYKWRLPLNMFFCTVKQTKVMVQNHENGSTRICNLLSDMTKKP
jgi:hypothetical protein